MSERWMDEELYVKLRATWLERRRRATRLQEAAAAILAVADEMLGEADESLRYAEDNKLEAPR